jgi:tetratricopeptide (TPR) repeat protein
VRIQKAFMTITLSVIFFGVTYTEVQSDAGVVVEDGLTINTNRASSEVSLVNLPAITDIANTDETDLCPDHFVQLGWYDSEDAATQLVEAADASIKSGLLVVESGGGFTVRYGPLSSYVEARLTADSLGEKYEGAFVKTPETSTKSLSALRGVMRLSLFADNSEIYSFTIQPKDIKNNTRYVELEAMDVPTNRQAYWSELASVKPTIEQDDPLCGYIMVNLGIEAIIAKDHSQALEHLLPVTKGHVNSSQSHRVMAMRRVAWIYQTQGDRMKAYQAYSELCELTSIESVKAMCETEKVGLLLELAESGKGSHQEVRKLAKQAYSRISDEKKRAVMELMFLETYSRQPNPDYLTAAHLGEEFIARNSKKKDTDLTRELATATYETGMYFRKAGDLETSLKYYLDTLENYPADVESFNGLNPHSMALIGIAHIARETNRPDLVRQLREDVVVSFPDSLISKKVLENSPELKDRSDILENSSELKDRSDIRQVLIEHGLLQDEAEK